MCLILFSYDNHPRYRLVFAANRDEFYMRPTLPMAFWKERPEILGGLDLQGGGTWMGVTRSGRIAAITNYRDPASLKNGAPSRGLLVSDYLTGTANPARYLEKLKPTGHLYNGYNLIAIDPDTLAYYGNRSGGIRLINPGTYGLSNHLLNTPWPKVERGKKALVKLLETDASPDPEAIFSILADRTPPDDSRLPDTGVGIEWERLLSPLFIAGKDYGTRSSTVILWERTGKLDLWERTFEPGSGEAVAGETRQFTIFLPPGDSGII